MNKVDALIAPRALTAREIAEVTVPQMIAYCVAKRAFIHAEVLQDGGWADSATVSASESALALIIEDAVRSLGEWLGDMEAEREPRFYRKASLKDAVRLLFDAAAQAAMIQSDAAGLNVILSQLDDRDDTLLNRIVTFAE
jgi:hypothetical protein